MTKKDYFIGAIIGLLIALLTLPIIKNLGLPLSFKIAVGWLFLLVLVAVAGLGIAQFLSRWLPIMLQISKFLGVGTLNTVFDLGILNLLIFMSGINIGISYSIFKGISFIMAVINSYFWNKYWTFQASNRTEMPKEFLQFLAISVIGFGINVSAASIIVNLMGPLGSISQNLWANIGALAATILSLVWNFLGYKFIVFRQNKYASERSAA